MFLVRTSFDPPENIQLDEVTRLHEAERRRAEELQREGIICDLWRQPDNGCAWGVWNVPSRSALEAALQSLPLSPYMTFAIHPIKPHPNALTGA